MQQLIFYFAFYGEFCQCLKNKQEYIILIAFEFLLLVDVLLFAYILLLALHGK